MGVAAATNAAAAPYFLTNGRSSSNDFSPSSKLYLEWLLEGFNTSSLFNSGLKSITP